MRRESRSRVGDRLFRPCRHVGFRRHALVVDRSALRRARRSDGRTEIAGRRGPRPGASRRDLPTAWPPPPVSVPSSSHQRRAESGQSRYAPARGPHHRGAATGTACSATAGTVDVDGWIALVLTDVDGRTPEPPWRNDELAAVLQALEVINRAATPCPLSELPIARDALAEDLAGLRPARRRRRRHPQTGWHARSCRARAEGAARRHAHALRSPGDNVLITAEGAVLVD